MKSRRRVNFYEAGSGQEVIRVDWFTLLFKVTRVSHGRGRLLFVASVNGATKLILNREVSPQVDARAFRHLNQVSEPSLSHCQPEQITQAVSIRSLLLTRAVINQANRSPPGPHLREPLVALSHQTTE